MSAATHPATAADAPSSLVPAGAAGVSDLLKFALDKGAPIESLERLVALQERIMDRNAAAEFFDAMAAFQRECPPIKKASRAEFVTKSGGRASYTYAELDEIARTVNPILARMGLSYTWDSTVAEGVMVVTCTLRHRSGHAVTAKFGSKVEGSPLMSGHQATAATLTYARRQSLVQVLGLTTTDDDNDGQGAHGGEREGSAGVVTDQQALEVEALITDTGADLPAFLGFFKIARVTDLPVSCFEQAKKMLRTKARQKAGR